MWRKLEDNFFIQVSCSDSRWECIVTDFNESWREQQNQDELVRRTKLLNKRIQVEDAVLFETLQREEPQLTTWATTELEEGEEASLRTLRLKYRIGMCPLHFEWRLQKQSKLEFTQSLMMSLVKALPEMSQQIAELREAVQKKDKEIQTYKAEGAKLKRTTVATAPFDFERFEQKFAATNATVKSLEPVKEYILKINDNLKHKLAETIDTVKSLKPTTVSLSKIKTEQVKPETQQRNKQSIAEATKDNLKARKRKALELERDYMKSRVKARTEKIAYLDSPSQSQELDESVN